MDQTENQINEFIQFEKAKIVGETAKAPWKELQRFYAQGCLILVDPCLNLIDVSYAVSTDDTTQVRKWLDSDLLQRSFNQQALQWEKENTCVWTVVVKPWILVQSP